MDEERDDSGPTRVRPIKTWPIAVPLVVVPMVYVLSMGPAVLLRNRGFITQDSFLWFYAPVVWLDSRSAYVNLALEWYLQLWV